MLAELAWHRGITAPIELEPFSEKKREKKKYTYLDLHKKVHISGIKRVHISGIKKVHISGITKKVHISGIFSFYYY